jgi:hypothetical protein
LNSLEKAFAPTGVEGYDCFLQVARACVDSRNNIEVCGLAEQLEYIDDFRKRLESDFNRADPLRPKTPLYKQLRPLLRDSLDLFREGLSKVRAYLGGAEVELLVEGCFDARGALLALKENGDKLAQEEATLPSPTSAISELMAMMEFVQKGMFEPSALAARCKEFILGCKRYREDVNLWKTTSATPPSKSKRGEGSSVEFSLVAALGLEPAKPAVQEEKPPSLESLLLDEANAACQKLLDVEDLLQEVCELCASRQLAHLDDLRIELKESEIELQAAYAKLQKLSQPVRRCLQCSTEADMAAKVCTSCGARLPEMIERKSTVSLMAAEASEGRRRLANFVQVEEAVENYRDGKIDLEQLQRVIDWFASRVRGGQERIKTLTPPNHANDPDAQARSEVAREHFTKGNQAIQACVKELQSFLMVQSNQGHLDTALEQLLLAEKEMLLFEEQIIDRSKASR